MCGFMKIASDLCIMEIDQEGKQCEMKEWKCCQKQKWFISVIMLICMFCMPFLHQETWKETVPLSSSQPFSSQLTGSCIAISEEKSGVILQHYLSSEKIFGGTTGISGISGMILTRIKKLDGVRNIRSGRAGTFIRNWGFLGTSAFEQGLFCLLCFMLLQLYGRWLQKLWCIIRYIHEMDGKKHKSFFEIDAF